MFRLFVCFFFFLCLRDDIDCLIRLYASAMAMFCLFGFVDVGRYVELGKNSENKLFRERTKIIFK